MIVAIKIYDKQKLTLETKKSIKREVAILKNIKHKAFPQLYDVIDSPS